MISTVGSAGGASGIAGSANRASVSREQFLKLLVTELSSQNPLDPLDNSQFMNQLVGLQTLEQTAALTDSLKAFEQFMQMSSAASFLGKKIKGVAEGGGAVEGNVLKVVMDKGKAMLLVGDKKVPLAGVQEILPQG